MFGISGSVKIYYCPTPINLRKSFDGLAGAVEEYIKVCAQRLGSARFRKSVETWA